LGNNAIKQSLLRKQRHETTFARQTKQLKTSWETKQLLLRKQRDKTIKHPVGKQRNKATTATKTTP
jgi:hypothetical protein